MSFKPIYKKVTWKIPNITKDLLKQGGEAKDIYSALFEVNSGSFASTWQLRVQFRNLDKEGVLSYYIGCRNVSSEDFKCNEKLKILDVSKSSYRSNTRKVSGKEFSNGSFLGFRFFTTEKFVEDFDKFVANGEMTVTCEIIISSSNITTIEEAAASANNQFIAYCKEIFQKDFLTDFKIESQDGEIHKCHKFVLAARSPVFDRMLSNEMKESKEGKSNVVEFDSDVIVEMLRFMYYSEVENLTKVARELVFAAEKYQLDDLKELCIGNIIENLSGSNVLEALQISHLVSDADTLFDECMAMVRSNFEEIRKTEDWKEVSKSLLLKVTESLLHCSISDHSCEVAMRAPPEALVQVEQLISQLRSAQN